jgi:hypothetical protein
MVPYIDKELAIPLLAKYHETIRAALSKPSEEWQPIETAPKDGTLVLLLDIHGNHRIGGYELNCQNRKWGTGWEGGDWDFKIDFDPQPTHWMPLPQPPQTKKAQNND